MHDGRVYLIVGGAGGIGRATAPSEARAERDDLELGPELWYALFLSTFLVGLLVLGGFWIWFNVPVL